MHEPLEQRILLAVQDPFGAEPFGHPGVDDHQALHIRRALLDEPGGEVFGFELGHYLLRQLEGAGQLADQPDAEEHGH